MVKALKIFVPLVVFGSASLAFLFLASTLTSASRYQSAAELKRESVNGGTIKTKSFSLRDYKIRLSQRVPNHPILLRAPAQVQSVAPPASSGIVLPPNSVRAEQKKAIDLFISKHNALRYKVPTSTGREYDAAIDLAARFSFRKDFSFPQPRIMRGLEYVSWASWVTNLRSYLSSYNYTREISLVTSNSKYTDVLLNWLISATVKSRIPVRSILIISLDKTIHRLMLKKQFCSILVRPRSLINQSVNFSQPFDEVMMTRLAVMRIINHFGYSFVMYDSDAILLKDPQPLYDALPDDDIIGSVGKIPYNLAAEWGITICIGVVLVRSSLKTGECCQKRCHISCDMAVYHFGLQHSCVSMIKQYYRQNLIVMLYTNYTESYWNSMEDVCPYSVDDQEKLNCGLKALDIHWFNNDSNYQHATVNGVCSNSLRVSILPYDNICRQLKCLAESRERYYIWHKGGQRSRREKLVSAREGQTWFLKYQWDKVNSTHVGTKWLESIAYYSVLHA